MPPAEQPGQQDDLLSPGDGRDEVKTISLTDFEDLQKRFELTEKQNKEYEVREKERENASLSEADRIKKENETLRADNAKLAESQRKRDAYEKALDKLPDGYSLEGNEKRLSRAINKLAFDENTIDEDVCELVLGMARPKLTDRSVIKPGNSGLKSKAPEQYTKDDLSALARSDPEEFKRVCAERNKRVNFPKPKASGIFTNTQTEENN